MHPSHMSSIKQQYFHQASFIDENGEPKTTHIPVVQEIARHTTTTDHFPKRFIALQLPDDHHSLPKTPPVIDFRKLQQHHDSEELRKLAEATKEWGMFLIKNHGVEEEKVLDDAKDVVKGFFGLSFEEKKANVGSDNKSVDNMGYGKNFVKSQHQPLDWIDRLTMTMRSSSASHPSSPVINHDQSTNCADLLVWPKKPTNFRQAIEKYVEKSRKVLDSLLQDLAESLSLDKNAFLQYFEPEESEIKVRVNYYPPCPRPDLAIGLTPHSDSSALTLLLEFGATRSLQVHKGSSWATLEWPDDNVLLVIVGDLLEIMSNGVFKSPWHRVRTQLDVERFSLAYFYNPPPWSRIGPVVGGCSVEEIMYKKVVVEDYVSNYYKVSPTTTKEAIMYAKIK